MNLYAYLNNGVEYPVAVCALKELEGVDASFLLEDSKGTILRVTVTPEAYTAHFAKKVTARRPQVPGILQRYISSFERVEESYKLN
jgi:hypothetical protein